MAEKIRVLLVDDSPLVRDMLTKSLSAPEHELEIVGVAVHGQDALDKLQILAVDVVVTDMEMPVMNGLDFIKAAMMRDALPIIVLSSWAQNDKSITLQALEAGAVDFIPKPSALNPQGFQETLARLVVKIRAAYRVSGSEVRSARQRGMIGAQGGSPPPALPAKLPTQISPQASSNLASSSLAPSPVRPSTTQTSSQATIPNYEERIPQLILGVGEFGVAYEYGKIVKTFALGSCVAVCLFSPTQDVVGMAHVALASSQTSPEKAKSLPGYFADTAIPALINEMRAKGFRKPMSQLTAKLAGGAQTGADAGNYFKIGEKNIAAIKQLLQALGITIASEDTGQSFSRTVFIQVGSKAVHISSPEKKPWIV
ncbi:MAG: response regulator [Candidatus Kapaibacterium sp.]|nr:MAG: response regulator [Candidatus Kapabacteria bacterium]